MSGSPFFVVVVPPIPRSNFEDLTVELDMDSSSQVASEGMLVSTGEYQLFLEDVPHVSTLSSPSSMSLLPDYQSLSQIIYGVASIVQSSTVTPP